MPRRLKLLGWAFHAWKYLGGPLRLPPLPGGENIVFVLTFNVKKICAKI